MFRPNRTKAKLLAGQAAYGLIHSLAHPPVAELIGLAGYDFIVIDGEHGLGNDSAHMACLHAVSATPATAILRVPSHETTPIRRALDLGFEGLLVPDVRNVAQARAVLDCCFYPPRGKRGFAAGLLRASDYGLAVQDYVQSDGRELLVCLMIESAEGVKNVKDIAALDGVDVIQLGPFDLSYDLGIPGQFEHPKFLKALDKIEKGVKAAGKVLGGVAMPGMSIDSVIARGYHMLTVGADLGMLTAAVKGALPQAPLPDGKIRSKPVKKTSGKKPHGKKSGK
jgi:4-hydroxy-2-oxoheptanedioate aldolase